MTGTVTQPNAMPIPAKLIASLTRAVAPQTGGARPQDVVYHDQHSNDVAELRFRDGRTLMVKRGRYDWTGPRFRTSRMAAQLLQRRARVVAPAPLDLPEDLDSQPVEAYWRVDLPTLQELWPSLDADGRSRVLKSWGTLVRRVHGIEVCGHGPLSEAREGVSFEQFITADLSHRLYPAVSSSWAEGVTVLDRLRTAVPAIAERVAGRASALLHNDLHMGNVLCEHRNGSLRCVGLLDLETAFAGPPEADLAIIEVHHGPHFSQPVAGRWFHHVRAGYRHTLDPVVLNFFRAYHLVNMGFYSALVGHHEHAREVAGAADREARLLCASLNGKAADGKAASNGKAASRNGAKRNGRA